MIGLGDLRGQTLATLTPLARGAWRKTSVLAAAIVNAIPKFGKCEEVTEKDFDVYGLLQDEEESTPQRVPYNPAVMQALQDGGQLAF